MMESKKTLIAVACLLLFAGIPIRPLANAANGDPTTPAAAKKLEGPIQQFIDSQQKFRHVSTKVETQLEVIDKGKSQTVREIRSEVKRDGERFVTSSYHIIQRSKKKKDGRKFTTHQYVNGGQCYSYRSPNTKGRPKPVEGKVETGMGNSYADIDLGTALDGYFDGSNGKSLAELLQLPSSKVQLGRRTTIKGENCREISAQTIYGDLKIWAAEEYDWLPLRVVYEKKGMDRWEGTNSLRASKYSSKLPNMASWKATLSEVVVSKIDDHYVATGGRLRVEYKLEDEHPIEMNAFYVRPKAKVAVEFSEDDKSFAFDLPEGAFMHNKLVADEGATYVWRKGQVVEGTPAFGPQAPKRKKTWLTSAQNFGIWALDFSLISVNALAAVALVRITPIRQTRLWAWVINWRGKKKRP